MLSQQDMSSCNVLVVEDDLVLRDRVLVPRLREYGFSVQSAETVRELFQTMAVCAPDVVVLDIGLPDGDGFSAARWLREHFPRVGVVMLTGQHESPSRIRGLNEGADAYLTKPVDPDVLAASLHALARRLADSAAEKASFDQKKWRLDPQAWCLVSPSGARVPLTRTERKIVVRLMTPSDRVVSREALISAIAENTHDFDPHRLDSLIHRLRKKAASLCPDQFPLTAVHGEGYVITA